MKNISSQCLPQGYLVPKRFHFGVKVSSKEGTQEYSSFNNYLNSVSAQNSICLGLDKPENKWLSCEDSGADISFANTDMYKKYFQPDGVMTPRNKDQPFAHEKLTQSIHIVCKATQSERITQFQMITSNKLENTTNQPNINTKWCPVDFYERPKQPFKRYDVVNVKYKEPNLKTLLLKGLKKNDKSVNLPSLSILYQVTSINDDSVDIKSIIDLTNDKAFLQLLQCSDNDEKWEDVLKIVENQLGEKFKNMTVLIEAFLLKKK